jgi:hypothetical protein
MATKTPWQPLPWQEISSETLPRDPQQRMHLRLALEHDLQEQYRQWLAIYCPKCLASFDRSASEKTPEENTRFAEQFDAFLICYAAERLGPRLLLCEIAVRRLMEWNDAAEDGVRSLERFTAAIVKGAKVRRGESCGTVDRVTKASKKSFLKQFQLLKARIAQAQKQRNGRVTFEDVLTMAGADPDCFTLILKSTPALRQFYRWNKTTIDDFLRGVVTPGQLVDSIFAWDRVRSAKDLANKLSNISE